jgi:hypothetical protein
MRKLTSLMIIFISILSPAVGQNPIEPTVAAIGTLAVFFNAIHAWKSSRYRIWGKLQATVFALACLGFLWFVFAGHLLSITSNF